MQERTLSRSLDLTLLRDKCEGALLFTCMLYEGRFDMAITGLDYKARVTRNFELCSHHHKIKIVSEMDYDKVKNLIS